MTSAPCLSCQERTLGCHSSCKKYILYKIKHAYEVGKKRKFDEDRARVDNFKKEVAAKTRRQRG